MRRRRRRKRRRRAEGGRGGGGGGGASRTDGPPGVLGVEGDRKPAAFKGLYARRRRRHQRDAMHLDQTGLHHLFSAARVSFKI